MTIGKRTLFPKVLNKDWMNGIPQVMIGQRQRMMIGTSHQIDDHHLVHRDTIPGMSTQRNLQPGDRTGITLHLSGMDMNADHPDRVTILGTNQGVHAAAGSGCLHHRLNMVLRQHI